MRHILRCRACGSYTMSEKCKCSGKAGTSKPAKFSPEDRYGAYRRKVLKPELISRGLL
ncbi:MAG: nucleolar RNA-binding Nop10p family protein [Candidatus Woesearchaeota archaeon]|nr:nucleolar RNA-binding Nop10p family protein [Candidatus Woesearchaeota archaeon]